ncbi:cell wall-associated NlpC family hydrolase [Sagittula marina]|uniref:Cell wall-associated NlpC family hydrolase n=1 Tax=Sagittula marina TaxID=943940 RepID=A0A7W6DN32_9RHOB|nr:NlpC/P60 family protein [Sagittula marina]MBB3986181.1 cell wall-associated NlpC family hydrolase [Sagittula marina]
MDWSRYVGIPERDLGRDRSGVDCWGLYRLVMAEAHGIELPSYAGDYLCSRERAQAAAVARGELAQTPWHEVETPQPFDLLLFRMHGHASHIGACVDRLHMLHTERNGASVIVRMDDAWKRRLRGIYRHEALL